MHHAPLRALVACNADLLRNPMSENSLSLLDCLFFNPSNLRHGLLEQRTIPHKLRKVDVAGRVISFALLLHLPLSWALADASFGLCSKCLHKSNPARMTQEPQWDKLCQKCQNFTLDPLSWPTKGFRDRSFAFHDINGLLRSANEGCHVCNLMVAELPESKIATMRRELEREPQHSSHQLYVAPNKHVSKPHYDNFLFYDTPYYPIAGPYDDTQLRRIDLMHLEFDISPQDPYGLIPITIADMCGK